MSARRKKPKKPESFAAGVGRGLRLAAKTARKVARLHGTLCVLLEERQGRRGEAQSSSSPKHHLAETTSLSDLARPAFNLQMT